MIHVAVFPDSSSDQLPVKSHVTLVIVVIYPSLQVIEASAPNVVFPVTIGVACPFSILGIPQSKTVENTVEYRYCIQQKSQFYNLFFI